MSRNVRNPDCADRPESVSGERPRKTMARPTNHRGRRAGNLESGYMLLCVFALAAIIAIGLYEQLPRAAFEAQREKEGLLIDHGEQYKRAIQLYCRKMGRYPAKIEDLDNTMNIRFLRKHYIDPMTGHDEWRLLHMGPNGKLIDSKIEDKSAENQWHAGSITEFKSAGSSDDGSAAAGVNIATRKRPSDDLVLGPMGGAPPPGPSGPRLPPNPANQASGPAVPGVPRHSSKLPGTPRGSTEVRCPECLPVCAASRLRAVRPICRIPRRMAPILPTHQAAPVPVFRVTAGSAPASRAMEDSVARRPPPTPNPDAKCFSWRGFGAPVNSQFQGQSPYSTNPGSNNPNNSGFGNPGNNTSSPSQMINNLLTTPRPGGAPAGAQPGIGGTVVGGLAGVASTHKGHGIRRYFDQEEYQKWEFFYDFAKELSGNTNAAAGTAPNVTPNTANGFGNSANQSGQQLWRRRLRWRQRLRKLRSASSTPPAPPPHDESRPHPVDSEHPADPSDGPGSLAAVNPTSPKRR